MGDIILQTVCITALTYDKWENDAGSNREMERLQFD